MYRFTYPQPAYHKLSKGFRRMPMAHKLSHTKLFMMIVPAPTILGPFTGFRLGLVPPMARMHLLTVMVVSIPRLSVLVILGPLLPPMTYTLKGSRCRPHLRV
jgi:hypothetical protein